MASIREQKSCSRILILTILLTSLAWGCTIGRLYLGSELRDDPQDKIMIGATTKSEVLKIYGPPYGVQRQYDGDVFIYRYLRQNSSALDLREPVVTRLTIFSFTRTQQKADSLVILFDKDGIVKSYGFRRGTSELTGF
jgi:outer membrane protein assembly factor BamE (lipoprotein component of BamABCDE complex)